MAPRIQQVTLQLHTLLSLRKKMHQLAKSVVEFPGTTNSNPDLSHRTKCSAVGSEFGAISMKKLS